MFLFKYNIRLNVFSKTSPKNGEPRFPKNNLPNFWTLNANFHANMRIYKPLHNGLHVTTS